MPQVNVNVSKRLSDETKNVLQKDFSQVNKEVQIAAL